MFFSMNIKLQKIETVLLQTSVGFFLQEFLRFILNVTLSDILKLEGHQMMWAFQKKKKLIFGIISVGFSMMEKCIRDWFL